VQTFCVAKVGGSVGTRHDDRERCLKAGMDGYVTKPINHQQEEALAGNIPVGDNDGASSNAEQEHAATSVAWDMAQTLESLGGDETLFQEVMGIFLREVPGHMAGLREAITQGNARSVEELSHTLKGEVGYLGIATLSQEIRELEQRGHKSELQGAEGLFVMFEAELSEVLTSIRRVVGVQPDTQVLSAPPGARQ